MHPPIIRRPLTWRVVCVLLSCAAVFVYAEAALALNGYGLWAHITPRTNWFGAAAFWNDSVRISGNRGRGWTKTSHNFSVSKLDEAMRTAMVGRTQGPLPPLDLTRLEGFTQPFRDQVKDQMKQVRPERVESLEELGLSFDDCERLLGDEAHIAVSGVRWGFPFRCASFEQRTVLTGVQRGQSTESGVGYMGAIAIPTHVLAKGFVGNVLVLTLAACGVWWAVIQARHTLRTRRGLCPACAYDLRGNAAAGCPECGWARAASPSTIAP